MQLTEITTPKASSFCGCTACQSVCLSGLIHS